ncbi:MAG TPA: hypothetical protein VEL79_07615 [Vicinamibacterales bacterium]|nr:hypothetical protein [Vicinamibacterales bacterium]
MRKTSLLTVCAVVLAMAASAEAQTKFTGTCNQSKPDPNYMVPVGDKADHAISLGKVKCTWTNAELAGVALKDEDDVFTSDMSGKTSHDKGYGVGTLANGDKYFVRFEGTTTMEKNTPVSATCTWTFAGGTGKMKGLTGKGTCTGKFDASGAAVFDIEGMYQVPAAKAK